MLHSKQLTLISLAALLVSAGAGAIGDNTGDNTGGKIGEAGDKEQMSQQREQVDEARQVVQQMKNDSGVRDLLQEAHGVFIVPDYAKAAAVVGGQGGEGIVLLRENGQADGEWTAPAFYDFGGASVGAEVGVKAGSVAMLLMSDKAADMFRNQENNWSLNAEAGLTIVDWSAVAEGSAGKGDVVVWSDTEGAFAGVDIGISDISRDEEETAAYYQKDVDVQEVLTGQVTTERAEELRAALRS